jgi:hypothetical protein
MPMAVTEGLYHPLELTVANAAAHSVNIQTEGRFSSIITHLAPGEAPTPHNASVVSALRTAHANAHITTWELNGNLPNNKFTFGLIQKGNGQYLLAMNDYISPIAVQQVKAVKMPLPSAKAFKAFAGKPEYWLVPANSKYAHSSDPYIATIVNGKARMFNLYQTQGSRREFYTFYGYNKAANNSADPFSDVINNRMVFSAEPITSPDEVAAIPIVNSLSALPDTSDSHYQLKNTVDQTGTKTQVVEYVNYDYGLHIKRIEAERSGSRWVQETVTPATIKGLKALGEIVMRREMNLNTNGMTQSDVDGYVATASKELRFADQVNGPTAVYGALISWVASSNDMTQDQAIQYLNAHDDRAQVKMPVTKLKSGRLPNATFSQRADQSDQVTVDFSQPVSIVLEDKKARSPERTAQRPKYTFYAGDIQFKCGFLVGESGNLSITIDGAGQVPENNPELSKLVWTALSYLQSPEKQPTFLSDVSATPSISPVASGAFFNSVSGAPVLFTTFSIR